MLDVPGVTVPSSEKVSAETQVFDPPAETMPASKISAEVPSRASPAPPKVYCTITVSAVAKPRESNAEVDNASASFVCPGIVMKFLMAFGYLGSPATPGQ